MTLGFSAYHKRLFVFLSVATFFEGYDFTALSQVLPNIQDEMHLSDAQVGALGSAVSFGTIFAFLLIRLADRLGRRRVFQITILGYAALTFLTGVSRTVVDFAILQFAARVFLVAEWALCMVYAAEEFPAEQRGFVLGVIQAFNAIGSVTCAAIVPLFLKTDFGWRAVYFVGVVPLLLLAYARRNLRETDRFEEFRRGRGSIPPRGLLAIMRSPYRFRVLQVALIWSLTYMCTNTAVLFWKQFAVTERGFSDADVARAVGIASLMATPFIFSAGKLLDTFGRRPGALVIYGTCAVFVVLAYQLEAFWLMTIGLSAAIFGSIALLALLNAFTTELFPTEYRAGAFAWANNLLGRIGYVAAPWIVGWAAGYIGWANAVSLTSLAVVAALVLILWLLPETSRLELEETAALTP